MLHEKDVLVDCRWLGAGGAGRATELLLRGLRDAAPEGSWTLWGPTAARDTVWPGARWRPADGSPRRLWGQADVLGMPRSDVTLYMHQIRPLRRGPSVTLIHDTIPLRFARDPVARSLKAAFLRRAARLSSRIVTVSVHSARCIERDLGVPPSGITVVRYPVDRAMVVRVRNLRKELPQREVGIFVGRFAPHKNLQALAAAFQATGFRKRGGRLELLGGSPAEVRRMRFAFARARFEGVSVEGPRSEQGLEEAYATSRFLVMPSLEEGFGLPAWEAIACGLPVCVSDGGALPEITAGFATPFPARSIADMTAAIDRAAEQTPDPSPEVSAPTVEEFAATFVEEVRRAAAGA